MLKTRDLGGVISPPESMFFHGIFDEKQENIDCNNRGKSALLLG
jgi:hypothetical protein